MSTALQLHTETMADWQIMRQQAEMLVKSSFLPKDVKTPEQALAIILMGRELGIGIMQAFNSINVIAGKPTISPQLMLALINRTDQLEDMIITDDGQCCAVTMSRRGRTPHSEAFSMKDAALMKTTEYIGGEKKTISLSEKYNWRQQPAVMRKWRAIAACARVVFPDVILGLYTPDEMGAQTDVETGEVIGVEVEPEPTFGQTLREQVQAIVDEQMEEVELEPVQVARDPRPKTLGDLVTPKQLWMIRSLAREVGIDPDVECQKQLMCPMEEISKKAASGLIEYLTAKTGAGVEPEPASPVKLEGAQPSREPSGKLPTLKGQAGQITALANTLGWNEKYLREEIIAKFKLELMNDLAVALPEIPSADAKTLIQSMKAELESRNRTK